jgi:serine phosphatase RsbU (regulator of sigma subunit)
MLSGQELKDITPQRKAQFDQLIEMADVARRGGDLKTQATNLSRAAFILWESNRLYDAVDVFTQAADIFKKLEDLQNLRSVYTNIGVLYTDLQDIQKAKNYFDESLEISRKMGQREQIASGLIDLAYLAAALGRQDESNEKLKEALEIALSLNNQKLLMNVYGLMASNFRSLGNTQEANNFQDKYQVLYRKTQEQTVKAVYDDREVKSLAQIQRTQDEKRLQQVEIELQNLMLQTAQDSLSRAGEVARQRETQIKLLEQAKELQDLQIEQQALRQRESEALLKQQQAVEEQQQTIIAAGVLVMFLMLIVAIILLKRNSEKKKANKLLEQQNIEILEKSEELETALNKIEKQNLQIRQSINYAKGIQQAMVPQPHLLHSFFPDSFIFWKPRDVVSGDFYWFRQVDHKFDLKRIFQYNQNISTAEQNKDHLENAEKLLIAAVDCTGHGVPGAFMSMIGNNLLDEITNKGISRPDMVLEQLHFGVRAALKQNVTGNKDGMDIALCLIDKKAKKLTYAGANNPLVYIKNGEIVQVKGNPAAIGGAQNELPKFETHEISLEEPINFYIFSDGFVDQFGGPDGRKFMIKKFRELLLEIHELPFEEQENLLRVTLEGWMGDSYTQIDDVLVVGFKVDFTTPWELLPENSVIGQNISQE